VFVVVDRFTKYARFIPTSLSVTAPELAKLFFNYVYRFFGMPSSIVSDRDVRYTSNFWRALCKLCGVELNLSTAFHPETDGQTERVNRVLGDLLKHYCRSSGRQDEWDKHLTMAEFCYNNKVSSSTGYSPAYLLFGEHPRGVSAFATGVGLADSAIHSLTEMLERMHRNFHDATEHLKKAQSSAKKQADKKRVEVLFEEGDLVMLETKNLKLDGAKKLLPRFIGPYKVVKVLSDVNYQLKLPPSFRIHDVFHVSKLKLCVEDEHGRNAGNMPPPRLLDEDGEPLYLVENILLDDWRGSGKQRQQYFLIKWQGYPDYESTWEPASYIRSLPGLRRMVRKFELDLYK